QPCGFADRSPGVVRGRGVDCPFTTRPSREGGVVTQQAILVLNAGSSSIKFLLFADDGGSLQPRIRGRIEGIHTVPHLMAKNAKGEVLGERNWGDGTTLGHDGAVNHLAEFIRAEGKGLELEAVGHRVVHGGPIYTEPVHVDWTLLADLE